MIKKMDTRGLPIRAMILGITCFLIIAGGVTGMSLMAASKKAPAHKGTIPKRLAVATIPAEKQAISFSVTGYGQANPVHMAEICPEVSGKIIEKHESLDQGGMVRKGEILFKINATDYESKALRAEIQVRLWKNQIEQFRVSQKKDQGRLETVRQNTALSKAEFSRLKTLYERDRVGTLSGVDAAKQSYNSLLDTEKSLAKAIALYPLQIAEAQSNLSDARTESETAKLNVRRCLVTAPFTGRIKTASVELGSYVNTGTPALTLADDSVLEIQVSLSDKDAFENLGLRETPGSTGMLSDLEEIGCRAETVTGNVSASLAATLHRAVRYDSDARTLTLAVRVSKDDPRHTQASIPLMDGMFCKVFFTGKSVKEAVRIPASALNADNTVWLARDEKLKTLPVDRIAEDGDHIYISGSFQARDRIITTPLSNPIENTRLDVSNATEDQNALASAGITGGLQ